MSEPLVIAAYVVTYGAILVYAGWLHLRSRGAGDDRRE